MVNVLASKNQDLIFALNPLVYFLKLLKLFKSDECFFLNVLDNELFCHMQNIFSILKISEIQKFFNKNFYLFEELSNAFLSNSYGNKVFTKLMFIFTIDGFEKKMIK